MKILIKNDSGSWTSAVDKGFIEEVELQDLLAEEINVLPLDEIGYEEQFVAIGKEVGLHGKSIDLLAISPSGQIAVIETKLAKNPEVKREVVGQLLSYAGDLWGKEYEDLERYFKKYLLQLKSSFKGNLAQYVQEKCPTDDFSENEFMQKTTDRLKSGAFSLLIVVDTANPELKNIANYINDRTGAEIDFYVIEVEQIKAAEQILLIPRLANPPRKTVTTKTANERNSDIYDKTPISKETFLEILDFPADKKLAETLLKVFENQPFIKVVWRKTGFSIQVPIPDAKGDTINYSFFLFNKGHDGQTPGARLGMEFPEGAWNSVQAIRSTVKDYREFYTHLESYREAKHRIENLQIFDDRTTKAFVDIIRDTANKFHKQLD